jgi:hypothetical protein
MASLSERTIASIAALRRPRVVVISLRKDIDAALADGLTLTEIWQQLQAEGAFSAGYDRFRRLVRRYVTRSSSPSRPSRSRTGKATATAATPGFTYNPTPNPDELF